jgi:hypothetical protein
MNGVDYLSFEVLPASTGKAFRVKLKMTDGGLIHREFERTFVTRNLL